MAALFLMKDGTVYTCGYNNYGQQGSKAVGTHAFKPVQIQGLDSFLDTDEAHYGLAGSATQVERIFPPENKTEHETWEAGNNAERLEARLKAWKFI